MPLAYPTAPSYCGTGGFCCSVAKLDPTLCDPMDCSPPGSSVHGILQARLLEWVAFHFPGDLPWIKPGSPALQADSLPSEPPESVMHVDFRKLISSHLEGESI